MEIVFVKEKETKNTIRYKALCEDTPAPISMIYVFKWYLGQNPPERIKVTLDVEKEKAN